MIERQSGSFRDPSGFLYYAEGRLYRQVNRRYQADYDALMASGLYDDLVGAGLLVPHQEVPGPIADPDRAYKILQPEILPFITYPYEWSFSQLRDAALTTLRIQTIALARGLTLKDASAYNIQFVDGRTKLIDTLSFERYRPGMPWVAYRQFCQHFLGPLALMAKRDIRLQLLLRDYIDGLPLDLVSRLLPTPTRLSFGLGTHIHLHARSQNYFANKPVRPSRPISHVTLQRIVISLENTIRSLNWQPRGTEWSNYYQNTNYDDRATAHKLTLVDAYLTASKPHTVWDLGANTGRFSRLSSTRKIFTVAADNDPAAVEQAYRATKQQHDPYLLPLLIDLTNPSPDLGWHNHERQSFFGRGPADTVMALALIHHLAISNNTPLASIAALLHSLGRHLIIEFVPKADSQVQRLLATREDVFPDYDQASFERTFEKKFAIVKSDQINDSKRTLYLMKAR